MIELLVHDDGVNVPGLEKVYTQRRPHDPGDLEAARELAQSHDPIRLGVFYRDPSKICYEVLRRVPERTARERLTLLDEELDRYAV